MKTNEVTINDISQLLTRKQFCDLNSISTATFQRLMREGKGPKIIKLKNKILICPLSVIEWRKNMER